MSVRVQRTAPEASDLAASISSALCGLADSRYAEGVVASRSPGKAALGVNIPSLLGVVRQEIRKMPHLPESTVLEAADLLWHGAYHEQELAACKMLRLTRTSVRAEWLHRWATLLDNWLDVDELGACVGEALLHDPLMLGDLTFLADSTSPWQRRLYLVSLIKPIGAGLSPAEAEGLPDLLNDSRKPVRRASVWLLSSVIKTRPAVAADFAALAGAELPRQLARILERVPTGRINDPD